MTILKRTCLLCNHDCKTQAQHLNKEGFKDNYARPPNMKLIELLNTQTIHFGSALLTGDQDCSAVILQVCGFFFFLIKK